MFGLGFWEILFTLTVALIVLGPEQLPKAARSLGRFVFQFRRTLDDIKREVSLDDPSWRDFGNFDSAENVHCESKAKEESEKDSEDKPQTPEKKETVKKGKDSQNT